jgi:SAM-dependent methyltransferase
LFANIDRKEIENVNTIIDFGCGTGDSSIVFNIFLPDAKVFLHDFSKVAVKKGLKKYGRFLNVGEANIENQKFDLVYSSNVIEHVLKPKLFVKDLIKLSKKYIIIQCPYKEYDPDGGNITPENPVSEHFWTIDEEFLDNYIFVNKEFEWTYKVGVVPMAWPGGRQIFIFGKLKQ